MKGIFLTFKLTTLKTIKEWLETLPEPYRGQALANCLPAMGHDVTESLEESLFAGFAWSESPEGYSYWEKVYDLAGIGTSLAPTNALSALHAIALKKGFPVEDITSVRQCGAPGDWWYSLNDGLEHLINLTSE